MKKQPFIIFFFGKNKNEVKKGRNKMVSKSLIFAAPGKDKRRKVRLNERIFLLSTFVGEAQTSEVSL